MWIGRVKHKIEWYLKSEKLNIKSQQLNWKNTEMSKIKWKDIRSVKHKTEWNTKSENETEENTKCKT